MKNKKHRVKYLRYCPGERSGSPATLPTAVALSLLARDLQTCKALERVGSPAVTKSLPHTGECSEGCVWYNYGRPQLKSVENL